jgi:hypothetical protein
MAYAKQEAIAEGLVKRLAEGRAEVERNLKAAGIDHTSISSATWLTLEDIMLLAGGFHFF